MHPGKTPLRLAVAGEKGFEAEVTATRAGVSPVPSLLLGLISRFGEESVQPVCLNPSALLPPSRKRGRAGRGESTLGGGTH